MKKSWWFAPRAAFVLLVLISLVSGAAAVTIVDKVPDLGPQWEPLDGTPYGGYVYANSFVFGGSSGTLMKSVGIYMFNAGGATGSPFRFEVYADNANAPDPNTVLGLTNYMQVANTSLDLVTRPLLSPINLVNGTRYWIAASTVGQASQGSHYMVGGHTQNSIYVDNGTFWFSNDPAGLVFDGQAQTPEISIYASTAIPEVSTFALFGLGTLGLMVWRRRKVR